jgi:hypothetical protein
VADMKAILVVLLVILAGLIVLGVRQRYRR